jgi:hypothetical protein
MNKLLGCILVAVVLAPALALAQDCPSPGTAIPRRLATMAVNVAEPVYRNDRSRAEITVLSGRGQMPAMMFTTGLTRESTDLRILPQVWSVELGGGRRCISVGLVEGTWRISELTVDVAREYLPGTCNYRVIRTHEDQHVALTRSAFYAWVFRMDAQLKDAVSRITPFVTTESPAQVSKNVSERLLLAMRPTMDGYERERTEKNATIDTADNYRAVSALCKRW